MGLGKINNNYSKKSITKPLIIVIIGLLIVFGGVFGWGLLRSIFMKRYFASYTPPPVAVSATKAVTTPWQPSLTAPGSLIAINGVQVSPQIAGMIVHIYFDSGQIVKKGTPLVKLDDADNLEDLKNYEALARLNEINYERQRKLYKTGSTAASALDEARANMQQAEAQVGKTKVIIDRKTIRAPFDGKIGIRLVNLGQYLDAGNAIASLQMLNPLYARFSLPEQNLKALYIGQPITFTVESQGEKEFSGRISAINSEVNTATRNILVQATIPNPDLLLYPGMYANVRVILPEQRQVITLPQTAVNFNLFGDSVFLVKEEGKDPKTGKPILRAKLTYVTVGERQGNQVVIQKGVNAGDLVVMAGQLKLQDGAVVAVSNNDTPLPIQKPDINIKP